MHVLLVKWKLHIAQSHTQIVGCYLWWVKFVGHVATSAPMWTKSKVCRLTLGPM
jgi:hypothetical protein